LKVNLIAVVAVLSLMPLSVQSAVKKNPYRAPAIDSANISKVRKHLISANSKKEYAKASKEIRKMGKNAIAGLMTVAKDDSLRGESRWIALMELGKLAGVKAAPFAKQLFKEKDWMVRSAAIQVVAAVGKKKYWKELVKFLKDPALVVRIHAVTALSKLDAKQAAPELLKELKSKRNKHRGKNLWIQKHIIRALGKFKHKAALKELKGLKEKSNYSEIKKDISIAINSIEKS
jgi:HEAT repeat protein